MNALNDQDAERLYGQGFFAGDCEDEPGARGQQVVEPDGWIVGTIGEPIVAALIGVLTDMCRRWGWGVWFSNGENDPTTDVAYKPKKDLRSIFIWANATPRQIMESLLDALEQKEEA